MTEYLPEEVLGHNCRFLQGPETDRQYVQQVRECLQAESQCQIVLRNYKKDGSPFVAASQKVLMYADAGTPVSGFFQQSGSNSHTDIYYSVSGYLVDAP